MQERAAQLDDATALPIEHDVRSDHSDAHADRLATLLMQIGAGNLSVGRVIEATSTIGIWSPAMALPRRLRRPRTISERDTSLHSGSPIRPGMVCA